MFILDFSPEAREQLEKLKHSPNVKIKYNAVVKSLKFLSENPKHPSLQTHQYYSLSGPHGEKIFEAYAEQNTPAAYRIFFYYGTEKNGIAIFAITPHP